MFRSASFAAITATIYLIVYLVFLNIERLNNAAMIMFLFSPIVVIWMAVFILKYGVYKGKELEEDEHWGYQDVPDKELL